MNKQLMVKDKKQDSVTVVGGFPGLDPKEKFKYLNILIHAPSGYGKTSFIASACEDKRTQPILVLDCDAGSQLRFLAKDPTTYTIKEVKSIDDISFVFNYLMQGNHPYKSVAIDNLTSLQKMGLFEFANGVVPKFQDTKNWKNTKLVEWTHWGQSLNQMCSILNAFRDLKMHSFFTSLSQRTVDEISKKTIVTVKLPGQQSDEIPGIPDIVGYINIVKVKEGLQHLLIVQPDGCIDAKDRTEALGLGIKLDSTSGNHVTKMLDLIWKKYNVVE